MLGRAVHDPEGLEGSPGTTRGIGLLPVDTVLKAPKTTTRTRFSWQDAHGTGYEIHMGQTERFNGQPLFRIQERNGVPLDTEDGCVTGDSKVAGTYIHGLFDSPGITRRWLNSIGLGNIHVQKTEGLDARDREYDRLAEHFEKYVDLKSLSAILDRGADQ